MKFSEKSSKSAKTAKQVQNIFFSLFIDFGHFKMSKIEKNETVYYFTFVLFCALLQSVVKKSEYKLFLSTTSLKKRH